MKRYKTVHQVDPKLVTQIDLSKRPVYVNRNMNLPSNVINQVSFPTAELVDKIEVDENQTTISPDKNATILVDHRRAILESINQRYLVEGRLGKENVGYGIAQLKELAGKLGINIAGKRKGDLVNDIRNLLSDYKLLK